MTKAFTTIAFALLLTVPASSRAQDTTKTGVTSDVADTVIKAYPSAILVQLRSERSRIEAITKARQYKLLEQVKKDAAGVITKTIADFHDNLKYCPVYYFIDTNLELVKKRMFKDVLFNADSTPVVHPVFSDTSQDYLIVYYGFPATQGRLKDSVSGEKPKHYIYGDAANPPKQSLMTDSVITDMERYKDYGDPFGRGLIINNCRFVQISYFYKFGYDDPFFRANKVTRRYVYRSKQFDMEYFPFAAEFNRKISIANNRLQKKHYPSFSDFLNLLFSNE